MSQSTASKSYAPHQQRVIDERAEQAPMVDRLEKLKAFIATNPIFQSLAEVEQEDLKEQAGHMEGYLNVLDRRISRF